MNQDRPRSLASNLKKTEEAPLELVIGHIDHHKDRKKRQFSMSTKSVEQLDYLYYRINKNGLPASYSAVVEQALNSYYALYRFAEERESDDGSIKY